MSSKELNDVVSVFNKLKKACLDEIVMSSRETEKIVKKVPQKT